MAPKSIATVEEQIAIGNRVTIGLQRARGSVSFTKSQILTKLQSALSDHSTMDRLRSAVGAAGQKLTDPMLLDEVANEIANKTLTLHQISVRDYDFLNGFYDPVNAKASTFDVSPASVLGVAVESGFASEGTYKRTGDAFGQTGGSTANMTQASSPTDDVNTWFANWGGQVSGTKDDAEAFINALEGMNKDGKKHSGWKVYNSAQPDDWKDMIRGGIAQMRRDLPVYLCLKTAGKL